MISWLGAGALATLLAAYLLRFTPFGPTVRRVRGAGKTIALTFDDGPSPPHTGNLLDVLARHGVKATFFMIGREVERHPECAAAVIEHGHEVGNHSYSHPWLVFRSRRFVRREIDRCDSALRKVGVSGPVHFRSPRGAQLVSVPLVLRASNRLGVLFDVVPRDWSTQDPSVLVHRALRRIRPGSIVLFHDGGGDRRGTVEAVDRLIPMLLERGYRFATVSELLALARTRSQRLGSQEPSWNCPETRATGSGGERGGQSKAEQVSR